MHAWTHEAIAALHTDAPPLGDLLPWRWVEADAIHVLADGSLGLAWRLPLLDAELLTPEQREPLARAFDGLLARLPAGVAFQVLLVSEPGRSRRLEEWAAAPDGGARLLRAMAGARARRAHRVHIPSRPRA
jgi:TraC protein